jgi:hypothetical protein
VWFSGAWDCEDGIQSVANEYKVGNIVRLNDGRTGGRSGPSIASVCIAAEKGTIYSVPLRFGAKLALRSSDFIFRVGR